MLTRQTKKKDLRYNRVTKSVDNEESVVFAILIKIVFPILHQMIHCIIPFQPSFVHGNLAAVIENGALYSL